jgi:hypothetical protein
VNCGGGQPAKTRDATNSFRAQDDDDVLAEYDGKGLYFHAKVSAIEKTTYGGEDVHLLQLTLNFMKPVTQRYRFRGARVDVKVCSEAPGKAADAPVIRRITPEADLVHVSDQEVSSGEKVAVATTAGNGPASVNVNMDRSRGKRTTFKGIRLIHGLIKNQQEARWRFYEEPESGSGLPPVVRLLLVVQCTGRFQLNVDMSAKTMSILKFGKLRNHIALRPRQKPYIVQSLDEISGKIGDVRLRRARGIVKSVQSLSNEATKCTQEFENFIKEAFPDLIGQKLDIAKTLGRPDPTLGWPVVGSGSGLEILSEYPERAGRLLCS